MFIIFLSTSCLTLSIPTAHSQTTSVTKNRVSAILDKTLRNYKWFHQNPELSDGEKNTAKHLGDLLEQSGYKVFRNVGGHGLLGVLTAGKNPKKRIVLFRADMDALPVTEQTGLPYSSKNTGVMHACGHDVHMASAVGALSILAQMQNDWEGTIIFVGQPSEELGKGANAMLKDAKFKKVIRKYGRPSVAFAIHDAADLEAGHIGVNSGFISANVDSVGIVLHGTGGHGAAPEVTVDPVVMGADLVMSLQTIVSRRVPAQDPAVITVGKFASGRKHNIISDSAELLITVRSYSDETRKLLLDEIKRITLAIARAHRAPKKPTITTDDEFTPSGYNDPVWSKKLEQRFVQVLGKRRIHEYPAMMGGEDFAQFSRKLKIPGVMWRVGGAAATYKGARPGLHSPKWAPVPEPTLRAGVLTAVEGILLALKS